MAFGVYRLFRRHHAAWWTLVTGLVVTAALGWEMHREAVNMDRQRLIMRAAEIQSQLDSRLEKSEMLLNNLRDFLMLSGESRSATLHRWSLDHGLTINCLWIHGILVATNRHTPEWRTQFPNPPSAWTQDDWVRLKGIMLKQPIDCEIALQTSVTNTKRYLDDYLLRSFGHGNDQFTKAVMNSRLGMSERRDVMVMVANTNVVVGTLFYVPIYSQELTPLLADAESGRPTKWSERSLLNWLHLKSIIGAPVDFDALVAAVQNDAPADLDIELFSSTNQTARTWLSNQKGSPRAIDPNFKAYLTHRQTWPMYGQRFSIFFHTTPLFEAQSPRRLAKIAMAAGTLVTLLATTLVGVSMRARNRQGQLTEQIREARDALAAAQREREKFSRDLHDGTIQSLYAIQLGLGHTVEKLEAEPADARREFGAVRRELDAVIAEIRQFITAGAGPNQTVDFRAVLNALVQRVRNGTRAQITLHCDPGASERLTGDRAVQLANIAREALSNSLRHARPQRVDLALRSEPQAVILEASDDGGGFDPKTPRRSGVGLASMAERARDMGATLELQSSPGKGTRVVVRVPAAPLEPPEVESPDDANGET